MPIVEKKFLETNFTEHLIEGIHDRPSMDGLNANDLKRKFDYIAVSVIAPRINQIIDLLASDSPVDGGSHNIGSGEISGISGTTVYEQLSSLKNIIDALTVAAVENVPDGSITDEKLSTAAGNILNRFATHADGLSTHPTVLATSGTAGAYTATVTGKSWAAISGGTLLLLVRPHADNAVNATLSVSGGAAKQLYPAVGGGLEAGQMKAYGLYWVVWLPASDVFCVLNPETHSHNHTIGNVTNLQNALDGKSLTSHTHTAYAAASHMHTTDNVTGLAADLAGKANASHTHTSLAYLAVTDSVSANTAKVVNVYFSTSATPPSGVPDGTLFIQYTA